MANEIVAVQYGGEDARNQFHIPEGVVWIWYPEVLEGKAEPEILEKGCDVLIIVQKPVEADLGQLWKIAPAYATFSMITAEEETWDSFCRSRRVQPLQELTQDWVSMIPLRFWHGQYGERAALEAIRVNQSFRGSISYQGHDRLNLEGSFGWNDRPIAEWSETYVLESNRDRDIWPELEWTKGVELQFCVRLSRSGGADKAIQTLWFDEFDQEMHIATPGTRCYMNFSLYAKGSGTIRIGPLHVRNSRCGAGTFLVGGKRFCDPSKREFCSLFDPMDLKPPLNVYFSGYRTAEGFEGYYMMRNLGAPFLLFTDPRLEGGDFYLGSEEYEAALLETIQSAMKELGFGRDDLILSGISMGTAGALYYGSQLRPHGIILGKPLINLGKIAENEKTIRPGGFPTSLDMLETQTGAATLDNVPVMNQKMWNRIDAANLKNVKIAVSYMQQDDYDTTAYEDLLHHLETKDIRIYGKGILGRHNDNTTAVTEWLLARFRLMLQSDYGRDIRQT